MSSGGRLRVDDRARLFAFLIYEPCDGPRQALTFPKHSAENQAEHEQTARSDGDGHDEKPSEDCVVTHRPILLPRQTRPQVSGI